MLMSATLGDTRRLRDRPAPAYRPARGGGAVRRLRPVPLDYSYARTPIHETIEALLAGGKAPIYVVHFTQKDAVARAQALTSIPVASRAERDAHRRGDRRIPLFQPASARPSAATSGPGSVCITPGCCPRYRRLVERLAQAGLLKVICGTDTLGVGINVPIRTVAAHRAGQIRRDCQPAARAPASSTRSPAGPAGPAIDREGSVVVQAPEHVIENERALAKVGDDPKKRRKLVRAQPPKGFRALEGGHLQPARRRPTRTARRRASR